VRHLRPAGLTAISISLFTLSNENLLTSEVINWSYYNNLVRIDLPVGVSYASDLEKAWNQGFDK